MKKQLVISLIGLALGLPFTVQAAQTQAAPSSQLTVQLPAASQKLNINTATAQAFAEVKGLGEKKAQAIVAYRSEHGNFKSLDDLTNVPGLGPKLLEKIKEQLVV